MLSDKEDDVEIDLKIFSEMSDLDIISLCSGSARRATCQRCSRPSSVCWCPHIPLPLPRIESHVYLLQHPFEETRNLRTAPMLQQCLPEGHCHIFIGKKFPLEKFPELHLLALASNSFLLFPAKDALNVADVHRDLISNRACNIFLLDGTWLQAQSIYQQNKFLHTMQKVQIKGPFLSAYVIRTQPTDDHLSTIESAAVAISELEGIPSLLQKFQQPLRAMCAFQLQHGAVKHDSKQSVIERGLCKRD